jgi:hypothetical protein
LINTLITGAGSSIDVSSCFLGGTDLLNDIIRSLRTEKFRQQLADRETVHGVISNDVIDYFLNQLLAFREDTENNEKRTIDEFLSQVMVYEEHGTHRDLLIQIGKYSIFHSILTMEHDFRTERHDRGEEFSCWISLIKSEFRSGVLDNIITFNYDRLLEHFLEIPASDRIKHVYGTISLDNWGFGEMPRDITDIDYLLEEFKIQHEMTPYEADSTFLGSGISHIYHSLGNSCFLMGFGFDLFNVRNLGLLNNLNKQVHGNLFEHTGQAVNFQKKRKQSEYIRRLVPAISLHYLSCEHFIQLMNQTKDHSGDQ